MRKTLICLLFPLLASCSFAKKDFVKVSETSFNQDIEESVNYFFDKNPKILYEDSQGIVYTLPLHFSSELNEVISLSTRYYDNIPLGKSCEDYLELRAFRYKISTFSVSPNLEIKQLWLCDF